MTLNRSPIQLLLFLLHAFSHVYVRAVTRAHSNCCLNPLYAPNSMIIFTNAISG